MMIHFPKPCSEDWQHMTAADKGKFCGSCKMKVHDLEHLTPLQIKDFLKLNAHYTCCRISNNKLTEVNTALLPKNNFKFKLRNSAVPFIMGSMLLYGTSYAQGLPQMPKATVPQAIELLTVAIDSVTVKGIVFEPSHHIPAASCNVSISAIVIGADGDKVAKSVASFKSNTDGTFQFKFDPALFPDGKMRITFMSISGTASIEYSIYSRKLSKLHVVMDKRMYIMGCPSF